MVPVALAAKYCREQFCSLQYFLSIPRVDVSPDVVKEDIDEVRLVDAAVDELRPQLGLVVLLAEGHGLVDVQQAVCDEQEGLPGAAHARQDKDLLVHVVPLATDLCCGTTGILR